MTQAKSTQGPWFWIHAVDGLNSDFDSVKIYTKTESWNDDGDTNLTIATINHLGLGVKESLKIARLISCAPKLLESLESCLNWMEKLRASGDAGFWEWDENDEYTTGLKVVKKARGDL